MIDAITSILQMKKQTQRKNKHSNKMFLDNLSLMIKTWRQSNYYTPGEQVGKLWNINKQYSIEIMQTEIQKSILKKGHIK